MTSASSSAPDPYAALGVAKYATLEQIRSAHRKLVLKAHPDRFPSASQDEKQQKADQFHKIQQAYELLSDANERQKYDRVQEMKADLAREREAFKERRSARSQPGSQDFAGSRAYYSHHETRGDNVYEVREPRATPNKYEDDGIHAQYEASKRYDEPVYRSSPRARNEEFKSSSRRTSARDYYEDERKRDENEAKVKKRQAAKDEKMKAHKAGEKSRDKARREDSDLKSSYNSPRIGAESDETESDDYQANKYSKKKSETSSKRRSDEPKKSARSKRSREEYVVEDSDDLRSHDYYQRQSTNRQREAEEYMKSMRASKNSSDPDDNGRSRHRRNGERPPPTAPSPPPAPKEKADAGSRSAKKSRDLSPLETPSRSRKDKPIEIVDEATKPSRRSGYDSTRRPGLKVSESAPPGSAEFHIPTRSHTMQMPIRERDLNPPRRSQTSNNLDQAVPPRGRDRLSDRERDRTPEKPRRREFSSPVADDRNGYFFDSPAANPGSTTRWRVLDGSDDDTGKAASSPRIVNIEPMGPSDRRTSRPPPQRTLSREASPVRRSSTRSGPRPIGLGLNRASTFQDTSTRYGSVEPNSPRLARAFTARAGSAGNEEMLYGEIPREAAAAGAGSGGPRPGMGRSPSNMSQFNKDDVYWASPIGLGNVQWSQGGAGSRRDKDRDGDRDAAKYAERGKEGASSSSSSPSPRDGSRREKKGGAGEPYVSGTMGRHGTSSLRQTVRT